MDLATCTQEEGELTTHWVRRVKAIIHSSDNMNVGSVVLMLEKNCRFLPLKQKLGRLKRDCNDMGQLMAGLIKYADSDSTKDLESDDYQPGKGKKNGNAKGPQHSPTNQGATVNARLMVARSLWLTPMHRAIISVVRGGRLLGTMDQVLLLSSC